MIVEKKTFPREKTCGDGLTPRAVTQLRAMGLEEKIAANHHRYDGLRCIAHGITLEMPWPQHPVHPSHGYVVRRRDLDTMVAEEAEARGARLLQGTEALRPILRDGLLAGAVVKDKATRRGARAARPLRRDRRRLAVTLRPRARQPARQAAPAGHGDPRLLREPAARRAVDRVGARRPRSQRRRHARATAGSSRAATGPSTSASGCCPRSAAGATSTPPT